MTIRSFARLAGLLLLVVWASQSIDYAAMWMAPTSYGAAPVPWETTPEDAAHAAYTTSASSGYSYQIPSPLSTLPVLCGGLLLVWCPRPLVRFLESGNPPPPRD